MKTRKTLKLLSVLLILSMVLLTPLQAIALGIEQVSETVTPASDPQPSSDGVADIIAELIQKRTADTKHFLLSDGTMMAVQYESPVHFREGERWIEYDNTMTVEDETLSESEQEYVNTVSDVKVKFAKKAKANKMVTYRNGDEEVSWGYADANKATVQLVTKEDTRTGNARWTVLTKAATEAVYEDLYDGVDLQVIVSTVGVKENLILQNASAQNTFEIDYKLKGLTAVQIDPQTVGLYRADGTLAYELSAPVMQDASGELSNALSLTVLENANGKLKLQLEADEDWLGADGRVYPVKVDPGFYTKTSSSNLKAITVYTGTPPAYSKTMLYASDGNYGGFGTTVSVVKFESLPELDPGDVVIDAQFTVFRNDMESTSSKVQIYASQVYSLPGNYDSAQYRAKWDSSFSYSDRIEDYEIETGSSSFQQRNFNITKTVKEWYSGEAENNGICLSSYCATTDYYYVRYCLTNYTRYIPSITITYRNAIGLESYWTYHSQAAGHGNAFINDFSGNLVYQLPVFSGTGVKNPASMSLYYNSAISNTVRGGSLAKGWSNTFSQRIVDLSDYDDAVFEALIDSGYDYAYVDADETWHYLKEKSTNEYVDEDGLKIRMTLDTTSVDWYYTLEYNNGAKADFDCNGMLSRIRDSLGFSINVITGYGTSGTTLHPTTVTDGAGRTYTLTWVSDQLTKITEPDGSETVFAYDTASGQLIRVTYDDGTSTAFEYSTYVSNGETYYRLSRITAHDGSYLQYTYRTATLSFAFAERTICTGIASVTEYAYDAADDLVLPGATLSISHNNDASATFTYTRGNVSHSEMLVFDALGRSTSALYSDGSATDLTYTPTATGQSGSDTNNRITSVASGDKITDNLLKDTSLNSTDGYTTGDWPYAAYNGGMSETFTENSYLGTGLYFYGYGTGIAGYKQRVAVTAGETYTFSAYAKGADADLFVSYEIGGAEQLQPLRSEVPAKANEWTRLSLTFTVPEGVTHAWVIFGHEDTWDCVHFDCLQLEKSETDNSYNLLENPLFKNSTTGWTLTNGTAAGTVLSDANGNYYTFAGNALKATKLSQNVTVNKAGAAFKASALVSAQSVCIEGEKTFALKATVNYGDGTTASFSKNFNAFSTARQRVTMSFVPDPEKTVASVDFIISFEKNIGNIKIYETSLEMDATSSTYAYDADGNMVTSKDSSGKENDYVYYDDTDLVAKSVNSLGEITYATYDSTFEYNPTAQWSAQTNLGTFYTYNANGTLSTTTVGTATNIVAEDDTKTYSATLDTSRAYIRSSVSYDSTGNYVTSVTDARGNTGTSNIDADNGRLNSETNAKGVTTSYTYSDTTKLLEKVSSAGSEIEYGYNSNRQLVTIDTGSTVYDFAYDVWGNMTSTKVGENRTLATTQYLSATSLPTQMTYGNGATVSYTYDVFDRITEKFFGSTLVEKYVYNNAGLLSRYTDTLGTRTGALTTRYTYDLRNRLTEKNNSLFSVGYTYDAVDRTTAVRYTVNGVTLNSGYNYDSDSRLSSVGMSGRYSASYTYDSLNRVTEKTVNSLEYINHIGTYDYDYLNGANGSSTDLVSSMYSLNGEWYAYNYDAVGNITGHYHDSTYDLYSTYQYDSLGQLTQEYDALQNKTFTYTYDGKGNILSVAETGGATKTYVYGDASWGDLLTSYDGQTITYDAIGNPLSYLGATLTWQNGRRLASYTKGTDSITYTYNAEGMRTSKTVNGTVTEYIYDGSTLLAQKVGNDWMYFFYDADGILGFIYNNCAYYYAKNLQGDVLSVLDSYGLTVCEYTYDSWGKLITVTDDSGNAVTNSTHVALLNPIRYRGYLYDSETGLYLTGTRYYDPEIGRFINGDGYVSTGQGVLGNNMFAYCGNNPVNRADPTGMFWKEIGDFFSKAWDGIKTWAKNTFGAGSSTTATITEIETPVIPDPSPITVKTGTKTTQTISEHGDSSKPISVYANKDAQHPIKSSSVGININIGDFTLDLSVGLDDIGISGSLTNGNTTESFGLKLNLSEFKVGFEGSTAIQWDNTTETAYTNVSVSGWAIIVAYFLVTTGQYIESPSYAY